jgi:23S rRNA (guanosine2251-2'-O)-methyltransferase
MRELIYGRNAVYESLRAGRRQLFGLQIAETARQAGRISQILELAASRNLKVTPVPNLKLPAGEVNHQGVALEAGPYPYSDLTDILDQAQQRGERPFVLLLDSLQDPQNLGSLLRTAEVVGVHGVVMPLARSVDVTPAVVNASAGASEHLLIAQSNLAQAIDRLKQQDVWIVGLDQAGELLEQRTEKHLAGALGLVVGSEGEGLHDLTRKRCDVLLQLPMRGRVESLNAAVAGSVALYLAHLGRRSA